MITPSTNLATQILLSLPLHLLHVPVALNSVSKMPGVLIFLESKFLPLLSPLCSLAFHHLLSPSISYAIIRNLLAILEPRIATKNSTNVRFSLVTMARGHSVVTTSEAKKVMSGITLVNQALFHDKNFRCIL